MNLLPANASAAIESSSILRLVLLLVLVASIVGHFTSASLAADHPKALFEVRELYTVGHFGNAYEVMGDNEFREMLQDAASWGYNGMCDWFDTDDCKDPFEANYTPGLGEMQWESKKSHFSLAQSLGLTRALAVNANHVYLTQWLPELRATKGFRVKNGQLICPSIPKARAIILKNQENVLAGLAKAGVRLDRLNPCPYDYGGCRCEKCAPWVLTYAQLVKEIHETAKKYHPGVKVNMVGWWWSEEDHKLFADWVDKHAPGMVGIMYLHLPYGVTKTPDVPLPKGCRRGAFIHIGYGDEGKRLDRYGQKGPPIAAARLEETVRNLKEQGGVGFLAYSEGLSDDVNKAILGGLATGEYRTADEALEAYCRRYFGVDNDTDKRWAAWLRAWGKPFDVDVAKAAAELDSLKKKTPQCGWRLRQWELKLELFTAHRDVGGGNQWTPERLAAVDRFWAAQEKLYREVWRLPPQRNGLGRNYTEIPWHAGWAKFKSQQSGTLGKEQ